MTFENIIQRLYAIGGIDRCGQPGFCLLFVLYLKAVELGSFRFKVTNKELMFKAGFNSRQHYNTIRDHLVEEGFLSYTSANAKKSIIEVELNTNILNIAVSDIKTVTSNLIDKSLTNRLQTVDEPLTKESKVNLIDKPLTNHLQTIDESLTKQNTDNLIDESLTNRLQTVDESLTNHLQPIDEPLTKKQEHKEINDEPPLQGLIKSFQR